MNNVEVQIPEAFQDLLRPAPVKVYYGGRGGAKTWAFGSALIVLAVQRKIRAICCREIQNSIRESVYQLLVDLIELYALTHLFTIKETEIECNGTGSRFYFLGLYRNKTKIKGYEGIDICWIEEAEKVSRDSLRYLIPTIRKEGSEIWVSFNPDSRDDPIVKEFVDNPRPGSIVRRVSWRDNPFITQKLIDEKDYLKRVDPDAYQWVWEGDYRAVSDALVFKGKFAVENFDSPDDVAFYYGGDFGFNDPATLARCFIYNDCLFIDHEFYSVSCDIDRLPAAYRTVPGADRNLIWADSSRPDTIRYLRKFGFNVRGAPKGPGSVDDGIAFMRSFRRIYVHERCKAAIQEFKTYSYIVDKLTGLPTIKLADKANHIIDSIRYALSPLIKNRSYGVIKMKGV